MLTHKIITAAIEVHKILGPGLLESAFSASSAILCLLCADNTGAKYGRNSSLKGGVSSAAYRVII